MTVLLSGYNVVVRPTMAQAMQRMYITNDFDPVYVSDDAVSIRTAGIVSASTALAAPAVAAGLCDLGTHLFRYRYEDTTRQRLSNPSNVTSVIVSTATAQLTFAKILSADATVNQITLEMSPAGNGTYYRVATSPNTAGNFVVSTADIALINLTPASFYGDFGHNPPPLASIVCEHRNRVWLWGRSVRSFTVGVTNGLATVSGTGFSAQWAGQTIVIAGVTYVIASSTTTVITLSVVYAGGTNAAIAAVVYGNQPNLLAYSRSGYPESFDTTALARQISLATGDVPSAMFSLFGDLYLIGQRSMRRLTYTSDPGTGQIVNLPSTLGAYHQRCIYCDSGQIAFGWGRDGMWYISALQPTRISDDIILTVTSLADATRTAERFVHFEPVHRELMFFFCASGETSCRYAACYSLDTQMWTLDIFRQGITAACLNSSYTDRIRLMLCDVNGSSWRVGVNSNDGGDYGVVTVGGGSTTTVIQGGTAVQGQTLYRVSTAETRLVSVGGTPFTVTPALSTTPTAGETVYLGSIPMVLRTSWFPGGGLETKKRPRYLLLKFRPVTTMGSCTVQFQADWSNSFLSFSVGVNDTLPQGVSVMAGGLGFLVDMDNGGQDGFIAVPMPSEWRRVIRAVVTHITPYDTVRFINIIFATDTKTEVLEMGE